MIDSNRVGLKINELLVVEYYFLLDLSLTKITMVWLIWPLFFFFRLSELAYGKGLEVFLLFIKNMIAK